MDLWHGTKITFLSDISQNHSLKASGAGRLGAGIYFANKEEAFAIAKDRGEGTAVVVLKCRVRLGNMIDCGTADTSVWEAGNDSKTGIHPPSTSCGLGTFREYCLKSESRHRI